MPLTPFHYPVAYLIYRADGRLSLPAVVVGAMAPDIEIPIIFALYGPQASFNRLVLHSLLGAATLGTLVSIVLTIVVYPTLVHMLFSIPKAKAKEKCRLSLGVVVSCLLGGLSHVLLDLTNHLYNPIFWPFLNATETPSPIFVALGGEFGSSLVITISLSILFMAFFINKRSGFWERLLVS